MHDLFEGVHRYDMAVIIDYFNEKKNCFIRGIKLEDKVCEV